MTRLQPLRTSASSLKGSRQCCRSANPLDTVQADHISVTRRRLWSVAGRKSDPQAVHQSTRARAAPSFSSMGIAGASEFNELAQSGSLNRLARYRGFVQGVTHPVASSESIQFHASHAAPVGHFAGVPRRQRRWRSGAKQTTSEHYSTVANDPNRKSGSIAAALVQGHWRRTRAAAR
jgi:hypothetical protein